MLIGREGECAAIDELLSRVKAGEDRSLVLRSVWRTRYSGWSCSGAVVSRLARSCSLWSAGPARRFTSLRPILGLETERAERRQLSEHIGSSNDSQTPSRQVPNRAAGQGPPVTRRSRPLRETSYRAARQPRNGGMAQARCPPEPAGPGLFGNNHWS